jgi:hypothetical protein
MYNPHMRWTGAATIAGLLICASAGLARADAPWVYRSMVLPRGEVAVDLGLGVGHAPPPGPGDDAITGFGLNLAFSAGVTRELEIGVRTGFRLDNDGQLTQADGYGRPFDTETYGTDFDTVANPEVHLRWSVARGAAGELGLELRAYLPIEAGSHFGLMFGLPIALHADSLRLDTGVYVPVIFSDPTLSIVSIPFHLWIQASRTFWLGPLFDVRIIRAGGQTSDQFPLGFGMGSSLTGNVDLRAWILFPDVTADEGGRLFGAGLALQLRFG